MEKKRNNSCVVVTMHDLFQLINVDTTKRVKAFATVGYHIVTNSLAFSKNRLFWFLFWWGHYNTYITGIRFYEFYNKNFLWNKSTSTPQKDNVYVL